MILELRKIELLENADTVFGSLSNGDIVQAESQTAKELIRQGVAKEVSVDELRTGYFISDEQPAKPQSGAALG